MPNILKNIADNKELFEAVREVFLKQFSIDGLSHDIGDELLGQAVRARLVGLAAVEKAMKEIESHKSAPKSPDKQNPAY